jgi:GNAT superfamily N-acetyltransferase
MFSEVVSEKFYLPDAPAIPKLSFRRFCGASDFPKMVAVIQGSKVVDQVERVENAEDVAIMYSHLTNSDPYQDVLIAEVDGGTPGSNSPNGTGPRVIAYSRASWRVEEQGDRIYHHFGFMLPEWRRKGIGRAMLRWNNRHLLEIARGHPEAGPRFFESFAADTEIGATALLESEGYMPVRHGYNMVRPDLEDIPDLPLPEGLEVRPAQPEHYKAIWEANLEAFRDHWGFSEDEVEPLEAWLESRNFDPTLWRVAWEGDQVAGMVLNFIDQNENREYNRSRGYTENICVRRPWRRRGLARALIALSLNAIKERGMLEGALGVDTQNVTGALQLYESMGFRPVKRLTTYRKLME